MFHEMSGSDIPEPQKSLLDHESHMTVTVEKYHSAAVDVQVLRKNHQELTYAREIVLTRQTDQQVVQYGIVRLNLGYLSEQVREEIEGEKVPLGRVLIEHNVMRQVKLLSLYEVQPGPALLKTFGVAPETRCYGRTAMIFCNDQPAIELLEIVLA